MLPMRPGAIERQTHDYRRDGTTTWFAALEIAAGQVTAAVKPKHRHLEFLAFLRQLDRAYPDQDLHLVIDDYATRKPPMSRPGWPPTPDSRCTSSRPPAPGSTSSRSGSPILDRQAIRRGIFTSVNDLNARIRAFINGWNDRTHPFVWTKTADEILTKAQPSTNQRNEALAPPSCCMWMRCRPAQER